MWQKIKKFFGFGKQELPNLTNGRPYNYTPGRPGPRPRRSDGGPLPRQQHRQHVNRPASRPISPTRKTSDYDSSSWFTTSYIASSGFDSGSSGGYSGGSDSGSSSGGFSGGCD